MLRTCQDWSLDARLLTSWTEGEGKPRNYSHTLLTLTGKILVSAAQWEKCLPFLSWAGWLVWLGLDIHWVDVTLMGPDLWLACSPLGLYSSPLYTGRTSHRKQHQEVERWRGGALGSLSSPQSYQNFLPTILVLQRLSRGCDISTNTWRRRGQYLINKQTELIPSPQNIQGWQFYLFQNTFYPSFRIQTFNASCWKVFPFLKVIASCIILQNIIIHRVDSIFLVVLLLLKPS